MIAALDEFQRKRAPANRAKAHAAMGAALSSRKSDEIIHKPIGRQSCDLLQSAGLLEEMRGSWHDLERTWA